MWMSLMTSGVKIFERPSTVRLDGAVSSTRRCPSWLSAGAARSCCGSGMSPSCLEDELALGRLEIVVVVEPLAAHELLQLGRRAEVVDAELALDELRVGVRPLARHAVDAERLHAPADVDCPVVHGVAEAGADIAEQDLPAALHHEPGHRAGGAEHDDRAALLVDPGAGADAALDHHVAAAQGGRGQRARVAVHHDDAAHHVLARRPADAPADMHLGTVDEAEAEVAQRAVEGDPAALQDADAERMERTRVEHRDVEDALPVDQPAQLGVDLARGEAARVQDRAAVGDLGGAGRRAVDLDETARVVGQRVHTITSPPKGSYVSISRSTTARMAISSEASATMSSAS